MKRIKSVIVVHIRDVMDVESLREKDQVTMMMTTEQFVELQQRLGTWMGLCIFCLYSKARDILKIGIHFSLMESFCRGKTVWRHKHSIFT